MTKKPKSELFLLCSEIASIPFKLKEQEMLRRKNLTEDIGHIVVNEVNHLTYKKKDTKD